MQENEFEKRVQQKMEEFELVPNDAVWKQVEVRIKDEERRKFIFFWLFAAILLVGGLSTWVWLQNKNLKEITINYSTKNNSTFNKIIAIDTSTRTPGNTSLIKENIITNTEAKRKETLESKRNFIKKERLIAQKKDNTSNQLQISKRLKGQTNKVDNNSSSSTLVENKRSNINANEPRVDLPLHKYYKSPGDLQQDSLQRSLTAKKQSIITDTSTGKNLNTTTTKSAVKNRKGWKPGFTFYGGVANNISGINLFHAKAADQLYYNSSALQSSASFNSSLPPLKYKSNYAFGVGAFVSKNISKRSTVTIGIDYHYSSAKSQVGIKKDSALNIYDTVLQKQTNVPSYYIQGNATNFSNSYHLIQLPVNFEFSITKSLNAPVFSLGLTPSILIGSNALYLNSRRQVYYQEKKQFNQFLLFGQTGLLFQIHSFTKSQLLAGPVIQYNFNSLTKWQTSTYQHLISAGIKANITFK